MDVSIIIVNWNTKLLLADCINSIYSSPPDGDYDIWVVDNNSSDGSPKMVRERFPKVQLIDNNENIGFARANNQAMRKSQGNYILLLNPDTVVSTDAIVELVGFLNRTTQAGLVGARLINPDRSLQTSAFPLPTLFREFWRMFHLDYFMNVANYPMDEWRLDSVKEVDTLLGACMLIRREALGQADLFDEDYFIYSEEIDLCTRLKRRGWHLYWVPNAEVMHHGAQSTQQVAEEMFLRLYEGKILYFRKYRSRISVLVYKLILFLATISRLFLTPFTLFENPVEREKHLLISNNYKQLLWSLPSM